MRFSDPTLANIGLIQRCETLCSLGDGGISNDSSLLLQFTGFINSALSIMWMAQLSVDKNAKSDDLNRTNIPDAPITMVLNQADYSIPVAEVGQGLSTFLRLKGVYFILNGVKKYLSPMDATDSLTTTAGEPEKYQINGGAIIFQCPLSAATLSKYSSVFHVEFQRTPDYFISSDTTKEPGILATYHEQLAVEASSRYLKPIDRNLATQYHNEFLMELENFKRDIALMDDRKPRRLTPAVESNE